MPITPATFVDTSEARTFGFRPWVRRTGLSILAVAAALTLLVVGLGLSSSDLRHGWVSEPFVAVYLAVLWAGGTKVFFGTFRPIAMLDHAQLRLRPLHLVGERRIAWSLIEGTEQMVRGDRLIVYFRGPRGRRYVALNLNLVRGRRDFLSALEQRLASLGFVEKTVGESRYFSRNEPKN